MKKLLFILTLGVAALSGCSVGTIDTGNVGVRSRWGNVSMEEIGPGPYIAFFATTDEWTAKEVSVELKDLRPRAKDNLYLKDLDATVYYTTNPSMVAEFITAKKGQSGEDSHHVGIPGLHLIKNVGAGAVSDQTSKFDSLTMHQNRNPLEEAIKKAMQADLDSDPKVKGTFQVTRVVITSLQTDDSIEKSIQANVQRQKDIEAQEKQIELNRKAAQAQVEAAKGIAEANMRIAASLTPALLQSQQNDALKACAAKGSGCTMIVGSGGVPLLSTK